MANTLSPTNITQSSPSVGDSIGRFKENIIERFEAHSRAEISGAHGKDSFTIRNELPNFLNYLCQAIKDRNLQKDLPEHANGAFKSAKAHGQHRVGVTGYSLSQVIREYGLLRQAIIEVLRSKIALSIDDFIVIDWFIDEAIVSAADVYSKGEQAKLKLALAQAEESNRSLDHFAMVVAHDLKSPLGSIAGFLSLIEEEYQPTAQPEIREYMTFIHEAVARMTSMIDGLLELARYREPTRKMDYASCNDAVLTATQNLKSTLTEMNGKVTHEELPTVRGNLILLTQLFQNLISNALKFRSERPPEIRITVKEEKDFWVFAVKDNGIGFDPKHKEEIFGLFKKLHSSKEHEGVGIGLATCRRVVELHGGKIWAESEPGKGSTIFFTLPQKP